MRAFAGLIALALGAAAASAMPAGPDMLGNESMPLSSSPSIATRPGGVEARAADQPAGPAADDQSLSDPALVAVMDRIERAVTLPNGARPLASYARNYAWADIARTKVTAIYLGWGTPGRKWIGFDDLPMVFDGGCGVIELVFDVKRGTFDEIDCHGVG